MKPSSSTKRRKRVMKAQGKQQEFEQAAEASFADSVSENTVNKLNGVENKDKLTETNQNQHRNGDEETVGDSHDQSNLQRPYEFLKFASPPLHTIFVPHFRLLSINFFLSISLVLMFIVLLIFNYTKEQNDFTWNCSLFQLQNKYFPRERYDYQLWRVFVSGLFHSNVAHFVLNLFGIQIYGYFIEWYFGKIRYSVTILIGLIFGHFLGTAIDPESVSTMSSAILFSLLGLKLIFFYEYWSYKPLETRKVFIYLLFTLVIGINLIPIFVVNNVDFSAHLGGLITGFLMGIYFYLSKKDVEDLDLKSKILKFAAVIVLGALAISMIALTFTMGSDHLQALNDNIDQKCN